MNATAEVCMSHHKIIDDDWTVGNPPTELTRVKSRRRDRKGYVKEWGAIWRKDNGRISMFLPGQLVVYEDSWALVVRCWEDYGEKQKKSLPIMTVLYGTTRQWVVSWTMPWAFRPGEKTYAARENLRRLGEAQERKMFEKVRMPYNFGIRKKLIPELANFSPIPRQALEALASKSSEEPKKKKVKKKKKKTKPKPSKREAEEDEDDDVLPPSPFEPKKKKKAKRKKPPAAAAEEPAPPAKKAKGSRAASPYVLFQQQLSEIFDQKDWGAEKKAMPHIQALVWYPFSKLRKKLVTPYLLALASSC